MHRSLLAVKPYFSLTLDISGANISTAAWTQLAAAIAKGCTAMSVHYSGDAMLYLGVGGAGNEVAMPITIPPGGLPVVPIELSGGSRLSLKAIDQSITNGKIVFNFFG